MRHRLQLQRLAQDGCARQVHGVGVHATALLCVQVAETAPEAIAEDKDSINGVQQLQLEATAINQNFSQQVRGGLLHLPC